MKYSTTSTPAAPAITPLAVENYAKMLEDIIIDAQIERDVAATMAVENNLIELACTKDVKAALESMSISDCKEIADLCNMSCESLAAMPVDQFKAKIMALSPIKTVEASTEGSVAVVLIISYFAILFAAIIGSIAQYNKEQAFVKAMWRKLEQAFPDKNKALDEVVVHMWDAKTLQGCLKNLAAVEKFLHNDMKSVIMDNKFKLADLEKLATGLWKSDLTYYNPDDDAKSQTANGWVEWWGSWKTNCPEAKGGSLRELGYTTATLEECCNLCSHYCTELMKIKEIREEASAAIREHQKDSQLGLWERIKRWWTETKEQKAERKENERILNYKYQAIYNLVWGYKETIKAAATGLYAAAVKADRVIKKYGNEPTTGAAK